MYQLCISLHIAVWQSLIPYEWHILAGFYFQSIYFVNITGSNGCMLKAFGENAFVCVCNSTYCDTVEKTEPQKARNGEYSLYLSDNTGKRLLHSYGSTNKQAKGIGTLGGYPGSG